MVPRIGNLILASADQVAIDAIAARIMGFDPLAIPYLRMCHERGLGVADPKAIELVGDADAGRIDMGFSSRRSLVIWGDQLIRGGRCGRSSACSCTRRWWCGRRSRRTSTTIGCGIRR